MRMPTLAQQARWIPRARRWLTTIAVLAALGILSAFVLPRWSELSNLQSRQRSAARQLGEAQSELESLALLRQSAASMPTTANYTSDPDGWIRRITDISGADRLHGITVQAGVPQQSGDVWCLPLVLNFDGDYLDACRFLEDAERLPAVVRVSTLHFHCTNLPTGQVEVQVAMNAFLPENP